MMSKVKMMIPLLLVTVVLAACSFANHGYPWKLTEQKQVIETVDDIYLKIKDETKTGLSYEIHNESEEALSYGQEVHLEVEVNGKWYYIDKSLEWDAVLLFQEAGASAEYTFTWVSTYGELPEGHYRLVKAVQLSEETIYLATEFNIG